MRANGVSVLPVKLEHVLRVESLEMQHRDPFDRMLIAQSLEEAGPSSPPILFSGITQSG